MYKKKIGLALSGGGAKAIAHLGVLKALEEEGINISDISGTSMGSVIAAFYSLGYSPQDILNIINMNFSKRIQFDRKKYIKYVSTMLNATTPISGIASGYKLKEILNSYIYNIVNRNIVTNRRKRIDSNNNINSNDYSNIFKIPISIPAVDLLSGKLIYFLSSNYDENITIKNNDVNDVNDVNNVNDIDDNLNIEYQNIITKNNLSNVIKASCSFPGIFEPEIYKNYMLVDGGLRKNLPVSILKKMGAEKTIAISFDNINKNLNSTSILTVALKCVDIMGHDLNLSENKIADIVIYPDVSNIDLLNFSNCSYVANKGYIATKNIVDKIRTAIL